MAECEVSGGAKRRFMRRGIRILTLLLKSQLPRATGSTGSDRDRPASIKNQCRIQGNLYIKINRTTIATLFYAKKCHPIL